MSAKEWDAKFYGESCGKHGTYIFYPGLEYNTTGRTSHLLLGNFFNISIKSSAKNGATLDLVGELQLVWHDKNHDSEKLSSVKLYARPEDCPGGRQPHHGQDEILAEEAKVVLRLADLVRLVVGSSQGQLVHCGVRDRLKLSACCNTEKCIKAQRPLIINYPQYCRYRAALKRLETVEKKFHNEILSYLLGKSFTQNLPASKNGNVYFCRDTTTLPELKHFKEELSHLAPRLKGRKRKKKQSHKPFDSDDSNESEMCTDHIVLRKNHRMHSSIDIAVLNGKSLSCKRRKIAMEDDLTKDKESFLEKLYQFMKENHSPIYRSPTLGFKEVDLHQFYVSTRIRGGYEEVTKKKLWKEIYDELGGSSCNTSAATGTRKNYEKFLQPFENFLSGNDTKTTSKKPHRTKKSPTLTKIPTCPDPNPLQTSQTSTLNSKSLSKVNLSVEPLVVIKPIHGFLALNGAKACDSMGMVRNDGVHNETPPTSSPTSCEKMLIPTTTCQANSNSEPQLIASCSFSDNQPEVPSNSDFIGASPELCTMSQKLLAGGRAVLNVAEADCKMIRGESEPVEMSTYPSGSDHEWKSDVASLSTISLPFLSTVLSTTSSSGAYNGHAMLKCFAKNSTVKSEASDVEDLCLKNSGATRSFLTRKEFGSSLEADWQDRMEEEPLDYSMKTLKRLEEESSLHSREECPLDLSVKKSRAKNEVRSEDLLHQSYQFDLQTPLDLTKSSLQTKEDRQQTSLPINIAQLLPLAFAMPLSSTLQVLPQVLSPIQQNINMIYNPGSINFPILSLAPTSSSASSTG